MSETPFDSNSLRETLETYPETTRYVVGFSGGLDSTALLLALCDIRDAISETIEAVHFNHGLNPDADMWGEPLRIALP